LVKWLTTGSSKSQVVVLKWRQAFLQELARRLLQRSIAFRFEHGVTVGTGGLRQLALPAKLRGVKRQFIALFLMLAIGLQGSAAAFAATSLLMSTDCQTTAVVHAGAAQNSCCPKGQRAMSCCLDVCLLTVGAAVSPLAFTWSTPPSELLAAEPAIFFSRGDSPLIRPPIL
jgi:hypothetical protein